MSLVPDPRVNWWCYTNHHVQNAAREYSKDRSRIMTDEMLNICCERDAHVSKPAKMEDFNQPIVLTCYQPGFNADKYGEKQCFLNVYGVRKTVCFMFRQETANELYCLEGRKLLLDYLQSVNLQFIRDLKLVYKRPYKSACVGSKLFLKLYLSGMCSTNNLRTTFKRLCRNELESLDKETLHDVALGQETRWFNCKRAPTVGRLKTTRPIHVRDMGKYYEASVHHDDVFFDNMEEVDCPFRPKMDDEILKVILTDVVEPVVNKLATGPTKLVMKHDLTLMKSSFMKILGGNEKWTWCKLKQAIVKIPFDWVLKSSKKVRAESYVKNYGGYYDDEFSIVDGFTLIPAVKHVFYQTLKIAYEIKACLKQFWVNRVLQPTEDERKTYTSVMTREISEKKRWLAFDIETDHKPHEQKEESIILISTVLFDHVSHDALEYVVFFRMPPTMDAATYASACSQVPAEEVEKLVHSQFSQTDLKNMTAERTFHIIFSKSEYELLKQFKDYVSKTQCSFIAYFNGNKFDLPFIANRHAMHFHATTESQKTKLKFTAPNSRERTIKYSFTYKYDEAIIRYEPPSKKHIHKAYGINVYAEKITAERDKLKEQRKSEREERRYKQTYGYEQYNASELESSSSSDENDADEYCEQEEIRAHTKKYQGFLLAARKIQSVLMSHVAVVDVMQFVGDPKRGCKLDTAAKQLLGFHKYEVACVSYDNMCNTWMRGDRVSLAAYCIIDTILVEKLVKVKKLNGFHLALGEIIGLPERELYLNESVRRLISNAHRIGYTENLLTPDTGLVRNDSYMWVPEFEFQAERDYKNLRPPAGSTVPDVFGIYYTPCATLDFKSQYPSIMAGYNFCLTSLIEKSDIDTLNLEEGRDYTSIRLENVKPVNSHACEKRGKRCNGGIDGKGDPRKCKYDLTYEIVHYTAYFVTETVYKSVLNRSSRTMRTARNMYKELRDQAKKNGNVIDAVVYDLYQLAVKIIDNSTYGGTMRFNGIVGDAITHMGRHQARCLANLAGEKGMAVVNGDTDSVFIQLIPDPKNCSDFGAMARYYGLNPRHVTFTDIVNRWFRDAFAFVDEANHGSSEKSTRPLYPNPCCLELEKVFISIRNYAKKCYTGDKITPELEVFAHKSGLTGKKADTTKIKSASQFVCDKLIARKDFSGLFKFIRDLHDMASWEIRHQEKIATEISNLCTSIPDDRPNSQVAFAMRSKIRELRELEDKRQQAGKYLIPLQWLISKERVGDVDDPKTIATKRAIELCKFRGEDKHDAPMFVDVCRASSVQVAAGVLKTLDIFLNAPTTEKYRKERNLRFRACHDEATWRKRQRDEKAAKTREETKRNAVTKLDVTAMPAKWRVQPLMRYSPNNKQRETAEMLKDYIKSREKVYEYERGSGYMEHVASRPAVLRQKDVDVVKKRLISYVEKYTDCDPFPPLFMFSSDMAVSSIEHLTKDLELPKADSACDIWSLYLTNLIDRGINFIKLWWTGERVRFVFSEHRCEYDDGETVLNFSPDDCSWEREHVHCLNRCATTFLLDMNTYREQTQSTPYIIPTYNGKDVYLANRDSYKMNKKDSFGFEISATLLMEKLTELQETSTVRISNVTQNDTILLSAGAKKDDELKVDRIIRADERPMCVWRWREEPFTVSIKSLTEAVEKLVVGAAVPAKKISMVLIRDDMKLVLSDEVGFNVVHLDLDTFSISHKRVCEEPELKPAKRKKKQPLSSSFSGVLPIECFFSRDCE